MFFIRFLCFWRFLSFLRCLGYWRLFPRFLHIHSTSFLATVFCKLSIPFLRFATFSRQCLHICDVNFLRFPPFLHCLAFPIIFTFSDDFYTLSILSTFSFFFYVRRYLYVFTFSTFSHVFHNSATFSVAISTPCALSLILSVKTTAATLLTTRHTKECVYFNQQATTDITKAIIIIIAMDLGGCFFFFFF